MPSCVHAGQPRQVSEHVTLLVATLDARRPPVCDAGVQLATNLAVTPAADPPAPRHLRKGSSPAGRDDEAVRSRLGRGRRTLMAHPAVPAIEPVSAAAARPTQTGGAVRPTGIKE